MADSIATRIVEDYKGLPIGAETHQLSTEQLYFRIRRTLFAALNDELETEYELPSQNAK